MFGMKKPHSVSPGAGEIREAPSTARNVSSVFSTSRRVAIQQSLYLGMSCAELLQTPCYFVRAVWSLVAFGRKQTEDKLRQALWQTFPMKSRRPACLAR